MIERSVRTAVLAVLLLGALLPATAGATAGVVVSGDSLATAVGVEVLEDGGNAVDAAVAVALALAVTFPEAGNLGGGGFLLAFDPSTGASWGLDFRETAPAATDSLFYLRRDEEGWDQPSLLGPGAAGIPGSPAGLWVAWKRGGRLRWRRLVEPARRLAAEGFTVGEKLPRHLREAREELTRWPAARERFFPRGKVIATGKRFVQPELAAVLERLETEGPDFFYRGDFAREMVEAVRADGGVWSLDDLASYEPLWMSPVTVVDPGDSTLQLIALPPPSSGGVFLAQTLFFLNALGVRDTAADSVERARILIESMRLAFADRNHHLGDPRSMRLAMADLIDPRYLRERARLLPESGRGDPRAGPGHPLREGVHTTHISILDGEGGAVALTTTINSSFGSKWMVPGKGFLLNNEMDDFDTRPGRPNTYGLVGSGVNLVHAGRRMLSSMSPTVVLRDGRPWLVLGARGGPRILSTILQVYLYRTVDGMGLSEAVAAPRLHFQGIPDRVFLEKERCWPRLEEELRALGYGVDADSWMAKVQAAEWDGHRGLGAADPRSEGRAAP